MLLNIQDKGLFTNHEYPLQQIPKFGEDQAQAKVVVTVRRGVVVTVRHTAIPRVVVPTTATVHAVRSTCRPLPYISIYTFSEII